MRLGLLLTCSLLLICASAAEAQTDAFPHLWVTDARVEGMAILGDTVFVAGRFDYVGPPTGQLAVLDAHTGEADITQPRFAALGLTSSGIVEILADGAGGYFAAGDFSVVSGQARLGIAHVLPDGTLDPDFHPDPAMVSGDRADVSALALDPNAASPSGAGVLYVGGQFVSINGQSRNGLAALDAATGAVLTFDAMLGPEPDRPSFNVLNLLVQNGVVYAGGSFGIIAGQTRPRAVALDGVTGALLPWNVTADGSVRPVALGDGTVYVAGGFDTVNGQPRMNLAEVALYDSATGGGTLTPWTPQAEVFGVDFALTPTALWTEFPALSLPGLRRVDRTSGVVTTVQTGCRLGRSLAYGPSAGPNGRGVLFLGCERSTSSGDRYPYVVGLDPDTGQPSGFEVMGATETTYVGALAVDEGGRLLIGGTFVTFGAGVQRRNGLAAFGLTTGRPTDFGKGDFAGSEDLALSPDGRFLYASANLVGGAVLSLTEFDLVTGDTRSFARSRPDPTRMSASARAEEIRSPPPILRQNTRVENATSAFVVTDDGAGGGRVCVSVAGVACYDRTTTDLLFYTSFSTVTAQGENNGDLLYLPPGGPIVGPGGAQGTLFLAGPVERGEPNLRRPALAAIDYATGEVIEAWEPGFRFAGAEGYALALLDPDGASGPLPPSLYAGGDRDWNAQGQDREGVAAFDPATATLRSWAPRINGGVVLAMAAHRSPGGSGIVYAGGSFTFINGERLAPFVAAFDAETGAYRDDWQPFGDITFVMIASEQHEAVFLGGFGQALRGTGHIGLVAVSPASPILPTAGEAGGIEAPRVASLALAGPNPLRTRTAIAVSLPEAQAVHAALYDVLGRRVAVLHTGPLPAGVSRIDVDASHLPAGVYVARVIAGAFAEALTLTVVR